MKRKVNKSSSPDNVQKKKSFLVTSGSQDFSLTFNLKKIKSSNSKAKSPDGSPFKSESANRLLITPEKKSKKSKVLISKLSKKYSGTKKKYNFPDEETKKTMTTKDSEILSKDLIYKERRSTENNIRVYKSLEIEKSETRKLLEIIEAQNKKIFELEEIIREGAYRKSGEHDVLVKNLKKDNIKLISVLATHSSCVRREEYDYMQNKVQELEVNLEKKVCECEILKEKVLRYTQIIPIEYINNFIQDINKIKREVGKLSNVLIDLKSGKELSLKALLGIENDLKKEPSHKIYADILSIKEELNKIFHTVSDLHAENYAISACSTQ